MSGKEQKCDRARTVTAAAVNAFIVILTAYGMSRFFTVGGDGNMPVMNTQCFQYFTVDSNLLVALASLLLLIGQVRRLRGGPVPAKALLLLKAVGTTAVTVTFFTVFCFLGFLYGFQSMIEGVNLYMHLITPLLAMLSFVLLETQPPLRFRSTLLGLLPTLLYGSVYMTMVVALKRWYDFYGFNMRGRWVFSAVMMLLGTWLLSLALWALRRFFSGKRKQESAGMV